MKHIVFGCLALAVAFGVCHAAPAGSETANVDAPKKNETYLMFSLNNRVGICRGRSKCVTSKNITNSFTIHGLWAANVNSSTGLPNCSTATNATFNVKDLQSLRPKLDSYMPTFMSDKVEDFWRHEFDTYGTCVLNETGLPTAFTYFEKMVQAYERNNLTKIWADFLPSDTKTYSKTELSNKLKNATKADVQLSCRGSKGGYDVLEEIRFCYDKATQDPMNCPKSTSCNTAQLWYLKNSASTATFSAIVLLSLAAVAMLSRNV